MYKQTLNVYNKNSACTKCGCSSSTSKHTTEIWDEISLLHAPCEEHIVRICDNCGYTWNELPLDSEFNDNKN